MKGGVRNSGCHLHLLLHPLVRKTYHCCSSDLSTFSLSLQLWEGWVLVPKVVLEAAQLSPSTKLFLCRFSLEISALKCESISSCQTLPTSQKKNKGIASSGDFCFRVKPQYFGLAQRASCTAVKVKALYRLYTGMTTAQQSELLGLW